MRVFVTGATGLIGSAIVKELISAGHQVTGLARSDASAKKLTASGAQVLRGSIEDLDCMRRGAAAADGAIHTAFHHEITQMPMRTCLRWCWGEYRAASSQGSRRQRSGPAGALWRRSLSRSPARTDP
jgi:D-arabinose 1-dehydrogenase-like Zn-dependent alcohol dehydrogenase